MRKTVARIGTGVLTTVLSVLASPTSALADPVGLTSGVFHFSRFDDATLTATLSPDLSIGVHVGGAEARQYDPPYICSSGASCAGGTFNLSVSDALTRTPNSEGNVVGGVFQVGGNLYFVDSIDYSIVAGSVVPPVEGPSSTWFKFSAALTGTTTTGLTQALEFSGGGTASSAWNSRFGWLATNYNFEDPSAVPEPASLLLLGTGLAGIAGLRGRRRRLTTGRC